MNPSSLSPIGIILANTGTPDKPTPLAVGRYLQEFLTDQHVIKLPKWIWLPILYSFILPLRPFRSAKLYRKIWTPKGSPMRIYMHQLAKKLQDFLTEKNTTPVLVEVGMNYGRPSIKTAIDNLRKKKVHQMIILPLYPQYSGVTTASIVEKVMNIVSNYSTQPDIRFIRNYEAHPHYIQALASSVKRFWKEQGRAEHLIISFHGLPTRFIKNGDPYEEHCKKTAQLLANALSLQTHQWTLCYQSRFNYNKWIQPYTQRVLSTLPAQGCRHVDVVCPGFAIDCLETLEEIAIRGKNIFQAAGGHSLRYIPALNDTSDHIAIILSLLQKKI